MQPPKAYSSMETHRLTYFTQKLVYGLWLL